MIFSRESKEGARSGRITPDVLREVFLEPWGMGRKGVRFLAVGTKEMMRSTDAMLASIGFPMGKHALLR